ncbi:uncharacterized protein V6R79_020820 [Siganus canaliculatus]
MVQQQQQQQQGLASCPDWSYMPREIKMFQQRGSVNILQFTRCVQSVMKNTLSMNPSFSNPARYSELTKYFKRLWHAVDEEILLQH